MGKQPKQILGQFYTTNYKYILQNMTIPKDVVDIIEPFAGNGDLLHFIIDDMKNNMDKKYKIECYDIDPKPLNPAVKSIAELIPYVKQDTLMYPPDLNNKFVLTNPPYLARNKCTDKTLFDKYKTNDLYKCFIQILINSNCQGGILIVPLNFMCSIRKSDVEIRREFSKKYVITTINIFEEQVFQDTSYAICSFQFILKCKDVKCNDADADADADADIDANINCHIYPVNKKIDFILHSTNNYTIGGEIYNLQQNTEYKIDRATSIFKEQTYFTNILVKCIDDSINNKIGLSIVNDNDKNKYIDNTPNLTARSYAILVIEPSLNMQQQQQLVVKFNAFLNNYRDKYNSLFLTNYRESNTIARKRISFGLVYEICNYLLHYTE